MNNIKIVKVKLIKLGEKLEVAYKETGELKATVDKVCDEPVHHDFIKATKSLAVHLAILTDYIAEKQSKDKELIEKFVVTGYSIGGKEEDEEGVTITGYRKTKSGQTVTLNSPFARFEQNEETKYILMGNLKSSLADIEAEVLAYLFEGKKADDPQTAFEFPNGDMTNANPEAMKNVAEME